MPATKRHATYKKFIQTVVKQLPAYIKEYSSQEQNLLTEFLDLLDFCKRKIDIDRTLVCNQLETYSQRCRRHLLYLELPFLWFSVDYISNASRILNGTSSYHAEDFLEYLVTFLRNNPGLKGSFQLLREHTSLTDTKWELLQYSCKQLSLLKDYELDALKIVYSLISQSRIQVLNSHQLKTFITQNTSHFKTSRELAHFFGMLDCLWHTQFYSEAFGLIQVVFFLHLAEDVSLREIIDFQDEKMTTLRASDVYRINGTQIQYTGILIIPNNFLKHLQSYFIQLKQQGKLLSFEVAKVTDIRVSASLTMYSETKGWLELSDSQWMQLINRITSPNPRKKRSPPHSFFLTPSFSNVWNYQTLNNPFDGINLYCKATRSFTFDELPFGQIDANYDLIFTHAELDLLRILYRAKMIFIGFFPSRLVSDFSLDRYWIRIPTIPLFQLKRFLILLPFCQIYFTENECYLWTALTPNFVKRIQKDLEWEVMNIFRAHYPSPYMLEWVDSASGEWNPPNL